MCSVGLKNQDVENVNKIYIPKTLINSCISIAHQAHFGALKTYEFIRKNYYWPGMFKDIQNFCNSCDKCLSNKSKQSETIPAMISKSDLAPGEMIAIDVVGKLPRSHDSKFFILTIIDHYSRFLEAIPLPNVTSHTIIKTLNNYFSRYGIPKILLSDNATNFTSNDFQNFLKSLNIEHRKSSIYFPRSNGLLERIHRSLKESVSSLSDQVIEWSERLKFFVLHYNNAKHSVTNFTPAELFFGRQLNLPINSLQPPKFVQTPSNYLTQQQQHINQTRQMVKDNETNYFNKHSKYLKGRTPPKLEIDDEVYLKSFTIPSTFQPKFLGPYIILRCLRNNNYLIRDKNDPTSRQFKVNVSLLIPKSKNNPDDNKLKILMFNMLKKNFCHPLQVLLFENTC